MRICFCSDLHGRAGLYTQLEALLRSEKPDLLILGGDMFPDGDLEDPRGTQGDFVHRTFMPWLRRMRQELTGLQVACILGNHDWLFTSDYLAEYDRRGELTLLTHGGFRRLNGVSFLGYWRTPPTPYWVKDFERLDLPTDPLPEMGGAVWDPVAEQPKAAAPEACFTPETCLARELESAAKTTDPWIFVCHAPPHETLLDRLPHIDHPVGSRAIRAFIESRKPLCSLHGHIHESPELTGAFYDLVGGTTCVNPGQGNDRLQAALLDTRNIKGSLRHTVLP